MREKRNRAPRLLKFVHRMRIESLLRKSISRAASGSVSSAIEEDASSTDRAYCNGARAANAWPRSRIVAKSESRKRCARSSARRSDRGPAPPVPHPRRGDLCHRARRRAAAESHFDSLPQQRRGGMARLDGGQLAPPCLFTRSAPSDLGRMQRRRWHRRRVGKEHQSETRCRTLGSTRGNSVNLMCFCSVNPSCFVDLSLSAILDAENGPCFGRVVRA